MSPFMFYVASEAGHIKRCMSKGGNQEVNYGKDNYKCPESAD
jgi:hypothetical protein